MAQDYLMRLVQQIAAVLAAIISRRQSGRTEEAKGEIATQCLQTIGLTIARVRQLTPDALAEHLNASGMNRNYRSLLLAELLLQDAEMLEAEGQSQQAFGNYVHAFCLLDDVMPSLSDEEQATFFPKREILAAKVTNLPANPYTTERIRRLQAGADTSA
jgi:hypothetical protein